MTITLDSRTIWDMTHLSLQSRTLRWPECSGLKWQMCQVSNRPSTKGYGQIRFWVKIRIGCKIEVTGERSAQTPKRHLSATSSLPHSLLTFLSSYVSVQSSAETTMTWHVRRLKMQSRRRWRLRYGEDVSVTDLVHRCVSDKTPLSQRARERQTGASGSADVHRGVTTGGKGTSKYRHVATCRV